MKNEMTAKMGDNRKPFDDDDGSSTTMNDDFHDDDDDEDLSDGDSSLPLLSTPTVIQLTQQQPQCIDASSTGQGVAGTVHTTAMDCSQTGTRRPSDKTVTGFDRDARQTILLQQRESVRAKSMVLPSTSVRVETPSVQKERTDKRGYQVKSQIKSLHHSLPPKTRHHDTVDDTIQTPSRRISTRRKCSRAILGTDVPTKNEVSIPTYIDIDRVHELVLPFCYGCHGGGTRHTVLCPKNDDFDESGAREQLSELAQGVNVGCPKCIHHFKMGPRETACSHIPECPRSRKPKGGKRKKRDVNRDKKRGKKRGSRADRADGDLGNGKTLRRQSSLIPQDPLPFCEGCRFKHKDHHRLCPRHPKFGERGSRNMLELLLDGVRSGCKACLNEYSSGKQARIRHDPKTCQRSSFLDASQREQPPGGQLDCRANSSKSMNSQSLSCSRPHMTIKRVHQLTRLLSRSIDRAGDYDWDHVEENATDGLRRFIVWLRRQPHLDKRSIMFLMPNSLKKCFRDGMERYQSKKSSMRHCAISRHDDAPLFQRHQGPHTRHRNNSIQSDATDCANSCLDSDDGNFDEDQTRSSEGASNRSAIEEDSHWPTQAGFGSEESDGLEPTPLSQNRTSGATKPNPNSKRDKSDDAPRVWEVPFCRLCNDGTSGSVRIHHALCPKHPQFDNSGAQEKLEQIRRGVNKGCEACRFHFENGRPATDAVPHSEDCERGRVLGTGSKPRTQVPMDDRPTQMPRAEPIRTAAGRVVKRPEKMRMSQSASIECEVQAESCTQKPNQDNGCSVDPESNCCDASSYVWVSCDNPWGPSRFMDGDESISMWNQGVVPSELHCGRQRFAFSPFSKGALYNNTHVHPCRGTRTLVLTRDPLGRIPWGFTVIRHDFGGACLVASVDKLSPATTAVYGGTNKRTRLYENDMILFVNGRKAAGLTQLGIEVEIETACSELVLVLSRYRFRDKLATEAASEEKRKWADISDALGDKARLEWCEVDCTSKLPSNLLQLDSQQRSFVDDESSANNSMASEEGSSHHSSVDECEVLPHSEPDPNTICLTQASSEMSPACETKQPAETDLKEKTIEERVDGSNDDDEWAQDDDAWAGCVCGVVHESPTPVFWIQCDTCRSWYNVAPSCVGFSDLEGQRLPSWHCGACAPSDEESPFSSNRPTNCPTTTSPACLTCTPPARGNSPPKRTLLPKSVEWARRKKRRRWHIV